MTEEYHHLDKEIVKGLLNGQLQALLLRDGTQSGPMINDKLLDQWLVHLCVQAGLPAIDQEHPYVVDGCLLFFANEPTMVEFINVIDRQLLKTTQDVWRIPEFQRFLGHYLGYPAGALYYALFYQQLKEEVELLVRYGYRRFRIGIDQAVDNIERLWLMAPEEDQITYVEYLQMGTEANSKMHKLQTHDYNGLEATIKECREEKERQQQKNVFDRLRDFWN